MCISIVACEALLVSIFAALRRTRRARVPAWHIPSTAVTNVPIIITFVVIEAILLCPRLSSERGRDQGGHCPCSLIVLRWLRLETQVIPAAASSPTSTSVPASSSAHCPPPSAPSAVVLGGLLWWWWGGRERSRRRCRCICGIIRRL